MEVLHNYEVECRVVHASLARPHVLSCFELKDATSSALARGTSGLGAAGADGTQPTASGAVDRSGYGPLTEKANVTEQGSVLVRRLQAALARMVVALLLSHSPIPNYCTARGVAVMKLRRLLRSSAGMRMVGQLGEPRTHACLQCCDLLRVVMWWPWLFGAALVSVGEPEIQACMRMLGCSAKLLFQVVGWWQCRPAPSSDGEPGYSTHADAWPLC